MREDGELWVRGDLWVQEERNGFRVVGEHSLRKLLRLLEGERESLVGERKGMLRWKIF